MNSIAATLLLSVAVLSKPRVSWKELGAGKDYTFDEYLVDFHKQYPESQYDYRKGIFLRHLAMIREHNVKAASDASLHWMHVNDFTDLENDEFRKMTKGYHHKLHNALADTSPKAAPVNYDYISTLPTDVDWREKDVVTPVKNQGGCGSCWAFSSSETLESHLALASGKLIPLSEQQLVSCAPNPQQCGGTGGCSGSTQPLAFQYVQSAGITTEADYGYEGVTGTCDKSKVTPVANITGQVDLPPNNYTALLEAVANVGPVAISVDAGGLAWQLYGGGVYQGTCGAEIDHAVQMVGFGEDNGKAYWLVRNSWGSGWGESGYIRLFRDPKAACQTDTSPGDGFGCKGGPSEITVCGICGILSGSSYPTGAHLL